MSSRTPTAIAAVLIFASLLSGCTQAPGGGEAERAGSTPGAPAEEAAPGRPAKDQRAAAPAQDPALEAQVQETLASYYAAFSDRNWVRFADHFWPGATLTTVWTPQGETTPRVVATTVPEFVEQAPEGPGSREIFEETMISSEIRVEGSLAQAWVRYRARFGDPGDVMEWEGTDAFTLLLYEGEWRITSLAYAADE